MTQRRYDYLLSALPGLDTFGANPPMGKQDLLDRLSEANGPVQTVKVLLLMDDLVQREAIMSGELTTDQADFSVLSEVDADNIPVLPPYLSPDLDADVQDGRLHVDALWGAFFNYAWDTARQCNSAFLKAWVRFEVGLRNALAAARAHALELDPMAYQVTPELADSSADFAGALAAWSSAPDPLAALEALDKARWEWMEQNGQWYSFHAQELEAYGAKLVLLHRWRRLQTD
ncbi:MAG: DUF2764 domain-containing protein [Phycisphaerae bacterium]|nr:DUF2764 domain-containing protein [Phycisphaerae bacterium]